MVKRMKRDERKQEILRVLRENTDAGRKPLTCRQITQKMGLVGYSYINRLLTEMSDDNEIVMHMTPSNKAISSVKFTYEA